MIQEHALYDHSFPWHDTATYIVWSLLFLAWVAVSCQEKEWSYNICCGIMPRKGVIIQCMFLYHAKKRSDHTMYVAVSCQEKECMIPQHTLYDHSFSWHDTATYIVWSLLFLAWYSNIHCIITPFLGMIQELTLYDHSFSWHVIIQCMLLYHAKKRSDHTMYVPVSCQEKEWSYNVCCGIMPRKGVIIQCKFLYPATYIVWSLLFLAWYSNIHCMINPFLGMIQEHTLYDHSFSWNDTATYIYNVCCCIMPRKGVIIQCTFLYHAKKKIDHTK
jgi:hypothetical protein